MKKTWILIANSQRARCLERDDLHHELTELADFVQPVSPIAGQTSRAELIGGSGKGHGRTGHAGTQFELRAAPQEKARSSFAHELADHLAEAVASQRCTSVAIIASNPMLGEIRHFLSPKVVKVLKRSVASDLTALVGPELKKGIDRALALPD